MSRILVIDDDEPLLMTLEALLTAAGHAVVTASDGLKAEQLFRAEPFEVIITDIVMPDREGLETITKLRREYPEVPVIAMSGGATNSKMYLELAAKLGARRTLSKPFTAAALYEAIGAVQ
jgi:DNA-binding response OmpR family regulator